MAWAKVARKMRMLDFGGRNRNWSKSNFALIPLAFGLSRCRVKPRSSHTTTRELLTCTFQGPGPWNTTKTPTRGSEEWKLAEEGKKARNFGSPTLWSPPFGAPPFGAPLCGHFFKVGASKLAKVELAEVDRALEVWRFDMKLHCRFLDCIGGWSPDPHWDSPSGTKWMRSTSIAKVELWQRITKHRNYTGAHLDFRQELSGTIDHWRGKIDSSIEHTA